MSELNTKTHGDGPRLFVALHGWNGNTATFEPLVRYLPEDVRLLAVDLPGYGESAPPEAWTLRSAGESVVDAVQAEAPEVRTFSVIGSCSGAIVGMDVARAARDRPGDLSVQRHVMLEPFAYVPWYLGLFLIPVFGRIAYWSSFGTAAGRWMTNAALAGRGDDDTDMMSTFADSPIWMPYRYLQLFDRAGSPADYLDVPGRKHLLHGSETFGVVLDSIEQWASTWPETTVDRIDGAGHLILEEAPERVAHLAFARPEQLEQDSPD